MFVFREKKKRFLLFEGFKFCNSTSYLETFSYNVIFSFSRETHFSQNDDLLKYCTIFVTS